MRRAAASACIALIAAVFSGGRASAMEFGAGFGPWSGALGLSYGTGTQSTRAQSGEAATASSQHIGESLLLQRRYYVLDPRFVVGSLGLQLNLNQDSSSGSGGGTSGRVIGYSFDSDFLAEKPYNASLHADRSQRASTPAFGGRTEGIGENRGLTLRLTEGSVLKDWGLPWFSAELRLNRDSGAETTTIFGKSLTRHDARTTLDLDLSKGFQSADLDLRLQANRVDNREFPQGNYDSRAIRLNYSLDFGPNLTRRLDSTVNWLNRSGTVPFTMFNADERLVIEHQRNLSTSYSYGFNRQGIAGADSTAQTGGFSVSHNLYGNLSSAATFTATRNSLPNGSTSSYGGSLSQSYGHGLPGGGRVFASWNRAYRVNTNQLGAALIGVLNEAHSAPAALGAGAGFVLDHGFAVAASIVVVDTRGGLRMSAVAGVDFDVVAEGSQTRIVPKGGSLVILAGDPLELSYSYEVDPSIEYATTNTGIGVGVEYGWITASLRHAQSDPKQLSGRESRFLESTRDDVAQLDLRGNWSGARGTASASFESHSGTLITYNRTLLSSTLIWRPRYNVQAVLALISADTQFVNPARKSATRSVRGGLDWQAPEGWSHSAFAELSANRESALASETVLRAGAKTRVRFGLLALNAGLSISEFKRGGAHSQDVRFEISAVRSF